MTEMTNCFSTGETRWKGRQGASSLGKRWQGWQTASALGKQGDTDGQWFQHRENVLAGKARRFST
jgi:hypothetical protein